MDALILARMQFAANITFHILFPTISTSGRSFPRRRFNAAMPVAISPAARSPCSFKVMPSR